MSLYDFLAQRWDRIVENNRPVHKSFYAKFLKSLDQFQFKKQSDHRHYKNLIFESESFRFKGLSCHLNDDFIETLMSSMEPEQSLIIAFLMKQGRGKTSNALQICKEIQAYHPDSTYYFIYSFEEANQLIKSFKKPGGLKPHDTIVLDEWLHLHGKHSKITMDEFDNWLIMSRFKSVNVIFNLQRYIFLKNVEIYLQPGGFHDPTRTSRLFWLEPTRSGSWYQYEGYITLPFTFTQDEWDAIVRKKEAKWGNLSEGGGAHEVEDTLELPQEEIDALIADVSTNEDFVFDNTRSVEAFLKKRVPDKEQRKDLAALCLAKLKKVKPDQFMKTQIIQPPASGIIQTKQDYDYRVSTPAEREWQDVEFHEVVLECLKPVLTEEESAVFRELSYDESVRTVARKVLNEKTNLAKVSRIKTHVQESFLGVEGGEAAKCRQLQQAGKRFTYQGGKGHHSDFIVDSDREVISFKCYLEDNFEKAKEGIAPEELQDAVRLGYDLILETYTLKTSLFARYKVIILPKGTNAKRDELEAIGQPPVLETPCPSLRSDRDRSQGIAGDRGGGAGAGREGVSPTQEDDL